MLSYVSNGKEGLSMRTYFASVCPKTFTHDYTSKVKYLLLLIALYPFENTILVEFPHQNACKKTLHLFH